jgi:uncharacterized protein YkwD
MISAKSLATLTLLSLLFTIILPLSAFAATEVRISTSGNTSGTTSVTVNGTTVTNTDSTKNEAQSDVDIVKDDIDVQVSIPPITIDENEPTATSAPTQTPTPPQLRTLRIRRTPTPTPTKTPSPTPTKQATPTPTAGASASTTDDKQTFIMNAINDYRKSLGLSAVKTDPYTCSFAKIRAQEITKGFNHDGFRNRINNNSLPYPSFTQVTENIAMTSDYKKVVTMWINSPGHAENMRRNTPFVCVESSGNYYAYEGWRH